MPRPTDPDRYPVSFASALSHAIAIAPAQFIIPSDNPSALRSEFYGYLRALRKADQAAWANTFVIRTFADRIEISTRDSTPTANAVEAALKAAGAATAPALPTFFHPRDPQPFDLEEVEQENLPSV
jgi:hypothetical protein